ncbi:winged helix-turn-helix transcriptional regulator [Peterkaempfera griseoplana]|uniref:winged helix-turn-helix transcriptional regulator n=1 Tax=Peterkaempfera griseoplana TaxID=66896 RepID=UPI0006E1A7F0|nr:helix-turn-helix domain-containing protein [Peterkaempfera griseoplana]
MPRRSYAHYCAVARALDTVGERWTLLIVRELLAGPRRYTDLHADLPGVSTDVLASRLRELEADGLVERRRLGRAANSHTYELTPRGRALRPVLAALAAWGAAELGTPAPTEAVRGHWLALPLLQVLGEAAPQTSGTAEIRLPGGPFHLMLDPAEPAWADGPADRPDAVLTLDETTAAALAEHRTTLGAAAGQQHLTVLGDSPLAEALRAAG